MWQDAARSSRCNDCAQGGGVVCPCCSSGGRHRLTVEYGGGCHVPCSRRRSCGRRPRVCQVVSYTPGAQAHSDLRERGRQRARSAGAFARRRFARRARLRRAHASCTPLGRVETYRESRSSLRGPPFWEVKRHFFLGQLPVKAFSGHRQNAFLVRDRVLSPDAVEGRCARGALESRAAFQANTRGAPRRLQAVSAQVQARGTFAVCGDCRASSVPRRYLTRYLTLDQCGPPLVKFFSGCYSQTHRTNIESFGLLFSSTSYWNTSSTPPYS